MPLLLSLLILPGLLLVIAVVVSVIFRSTKEDSQPAQDDGPGRYRIAGSRPGGEQISTVIEADSWADACKQAEDRGIEVTVVQRLIG